MEIIVGYGVVPRTEKILWHYWDHLSMVDIARLYYNTPFKFHQGVTQGGPLSLTIFNMVFGAFICHWVTIVLGEEAGPDGFRRSTQWLAALF